MPIAWNLWLAGGGAAGGDYETPTTNYIRLRTGITEDVEKLSPSQLNSKFLGLIPAAEAKVALRVTIPKFISTTLNEYERQALIDAVALRVGAMYLARPEVQDATGSEQPRTMDGRTISEVRVDLNLEARSLEALVIGGSERLRALARPYS